MVVVGLSDWCRIRTAEAQVAQAGHRSSFDGSDTAQHTEPVFEDRTTEQDSEGQLEEGMGMSAAGRPWSIRFAPSSSLSRAGGQVDMRLSRCLSI